MSHQQPSVQAEYLGQFKDPAGKVTAENLRALLAEANHLGYAQLAGVIDPDTWGIAVPVLDGKKPVGGLGRQDFEVYEDGVQQSVRFFESQRVPLDVILLLDTSSSMRGKMDVVHHAARGFMKVLRPEDRG